MNIVIKRYLNTHDITRATAFTRTSGDMSDIIIVVKKAEGKTGIAVSADFLEENLDAEFCAKNDIEVSRSSVNYGSFGNVLSVPEVTFAILFPFRDGITVMKINEVFLDIFSILGEIKRENNDFLIDGKKLMGMAVYPGQLVAIGSLYSFSEDIDNIYSDYFRENSGKVMPSERVIGYNTLAPEPINIRGFAFLMREAFNRVTDINIDEVLEIDGDSEGDL